MTTKITEEASTGASGPDLSELADQLVATARTSGIELTGPGGLLTGLTKQVLETALDVELTEHLGYDRHERTGGGGNVRHGSTAKTVRTDVGDVRITVPRDRAGSASPRPWCPSTRVGWSGSTTPCSASMPKGMTTGDIVNHLGDIYGTEVSRDLVSRVTDGVVEQMPEWQNRPLDPATRCC